MFVEFFCKLKFLYLKVIYCIFILEDKQLIISVYINNLLLFSLNLSWLEQIEQDLHNCFKITNFGNIFYYLGTEINYIIKDKITF